MPIVQENPTYFSNKSGSVTAISSRSSKQPRCGVNSYGARRKNSVTSFEGTEDSEMETFLSSYESSNGYTDTEAKVSLPPINGKKVLRKGKGSIDSCHKTNNNNVLLSEGNSRDISVKTNSNMIIDSSFTNKYSIENAQQVNKSGMSSLTRLGQLFKKSKSKASVGSESHASTIESSGIGSPTCTPDSSLSIYTNSLDGDSQSSTNSNQISPGYLEGAKEDKLCSTYTFDDCGIYAANMYYNVGEPSVFTIYHQHNNGSSNSANNGKPVLASVKRRSGTGRAYSVGAVSDQDSELVDCVQTYYNNTTFSTFPNPKRCSVASAASTTTSSVIPVPIPPFNNESTDNVSPRRTTGFHPIQQDGDGYLKPNEPRNLRNPKNLYINDSIIEKANGQVHQVHVDVHTPTSSSLKCAVNQTGNCLPFSETTAQNSMSFNSSAASISTNNSNRYHFDSSSSATSAATTLVVGGSNNFLCELPDDDTTDDARGSRKGRNDSHNSRQRQQRIPSMSVAADCEPYCSLCASSITGSPRQRSRMDVAIVKCKECFFSREAEGSIRAFFDKLLLKGDKQKLDVTLRSYDLKDLDHPTDRVVVHSAKVQIVIISHHFLQRLKDEASRRPRLSPINRVFRSKNVIAVLLAVTAKEVTEGYESVLPRFAEWFSVDLRSANKPDADFGKKFVNQVVKIYNLELSNSSNFSVFPKKVTKDQPKIAIVFKKPVEENDEVRVELKAALQQIVISDLKLENPHTAILRIPDSLSPNREAIVDVSVYVNNNKIGGSRVKSELNMRRVEDDEVDRMAKLLPPFLEWLDKHTGETLLKHYRECTDYTTDPELELMNGHIISKSDILPTIMHFAAYYGLRKTAFILLEEADGLQSCSVKNEMDETPADIAFARGFTEIGQLIKDYQEIINWNKAIRYIKDMVEKDSILEPEISNAGENIGNNFDLTSSGNMSDDVFADIESVTDNQDPAELVEATLEATECTKSSDQEEEESQGKSSEEDERTTEEAPPTPSMRKSRKVMSPNNRQTYINLPGGNPAHNPEIVQTRDKPKVIQSTEAAKKRFSFKPTDYYDTPRLQDQDYQHPPKHARPVYPEEDESVTSPIFKPKTQGPIVTKSGYLIIDPVDSAQSSDGSQQFGPTLKPEKPKRKLSPQRNLDNGATVSAPAPVTQTNLLAPRQRRNEGDPVTLDSADEQLLELIKSFKTNTYSIKQIELLFENWKQRPDVQRSIEMKAEMIEKMRKEYHQLQPKQGAKKTSVFAKVVSTFNLKKKRSNTQALSSSPTSSTSSLSLTSSRPKESVDGDSRVPCVSPTALTFTGPDLPNQTTNISSAFQPPQSDPYRVSEVSYRTSIDSRISDSSADSDKPFNEVFTNCPKSTDCKPQPLEYYNPLSKRLIPSYVYPQTVSVVPGESIPKMVTNDDSYQVPPPPRPVKPANKLTIENKSNHSSTDNLSGEPPLPSKTSKPPPALPAKSSPKYLGTEPTSPPPPPPPRNNNSPNMFSYIDYKTKVQAVQMDQTKSEVTKSYENLTEGD